MENCPDCGSENFSQSSYDPPCVWLECHECGLTWEDCPDEDDTDYDSHHETGIETWQESDEWT